MALTKVSGGILDPGIDVAGIVTATGFDGPFVGGSSKNITAGTVTATELDLNGDGDISGNLVVGGNLTANGDFTTLNTTLREVELLRVESNSSAVAGIITQSGSGDILKLYDSSTPVFVVKDDGKVGIGSATPAYALDLGESSSTIRLVSENNGTAIRIGAGNGNNNVTLLRVDGDGTVHHGESNNSKYGFSFKYMGSRTGNNNSFSLFADDQTGTQFEAITVLQDGKVGIGSTIPTEKLDVNGDTKLQGDLNVTGITTTLQLQVGASGQTLVGITTILDEDNFASNSATALVTQQSIKKYVDDRTPQGIGGGALSITADDGGNTSIDLATETLDIEGTANEIVTATGAGITANTVVIGLPDNVTIGNNLTVNNEVGISSNLNVSGIITASNIDIDGGSNTLMNLKFQNNLTGSNDHDGASIAYSTNSHGMFFSAYESGGHMIFQTAGNHLNNRTLIISNTGVVTLQRNQESMLVATPNSHVKLYYNDTERLSTSGIGVTVTGEVAASQDYPNFRPTLDLNFAAEKKLDPRITYQRTGPASYVNEFGRVVLIGANEPRFDYGYEYVNTNSYKLTNSESKGILIESQRTNLVAYSIYNGDKSGTAQTNTGNIGNWSLTLGNATYTGGIDAPDGSNDAVRFTNLNTGASLLRISIPSFTPNGSDTYTLSFYVRGISGTGSLQCDLNDGGPMLTDWHNQIVTNEWVRIVVSDIPSNEAKTFVDISNNVDNNRVFDVWGVQLEKGSFATSFIPTRGKTETRGADIVEITEEEFSEFYNRTEGSFVSEIMLKPSFPVSGFASIMMSLSDGSYDNRITLASSTGSATFNADVNVGGTDNRASLGSYTSGSHSIKAALAYKQADSAGSLNGAAAVTTSSLPGTLPLLTRADIGKDHQNGNLLNGHIKRIMYYSKRLSNNQLRTLTS